MTTDDRTYGLLPRQQPQTPADQFLADLRDPFQGAGNDVQAKSVWIALGTSLGAMIIITLLFSLLRPHNTVIYAPKLKAADNKHAPPPIGKGLFAWFGPVRTTDEVQMIEKVGLDAAIFLRFTRMCRNMFLCLSVIGCGILIPIHVFFSTKFFSNSNQPSLNASQIFAIMTPQWVFGNALWSHVVCSYLFDITMMYFLWTNYRAIVRLKRHYFESAEYQKSLHSRSIWLNDIPTTERSDEGILRIADSVEHTVGVPNAAIARNVKELPKMIELHSQAVRKLESVLAKYLKKPDNLPASRPTIRPSKKDDNRGTKVDAIDYLTGRIRDLEAKIQAVRESLDKRNPMAYGFATYERIEEAHTVAYAARKKSPKGVTIRLAPTPKEIIWDNIPLSKVARRNKRLMNNIWVGLLTIIWVAPNAMIAIFLTNLANISALWPAFRDSFNGNRTVWAIVQAIAAPGLTSLIYFFLPIIFRRMSQKAGDLTKTQRERHVTQKLYAFFIFNNLIVFSTFAAMWNFISQVIKLRGEGLNAWDAIQQSNLPNTIMIALCQVSPFWVTWLLQRNLGSATDISQIFNLIWVWCARTFFNPTPRQTIEWTAPQWFDYASYYNYFLYYATVTLCYATIQPIVLPVTAFFFFADVWLKKYLLLYVFITKTESGGQLWNMLFNRVLFAILLANIVAALVIKGATWAEGWTMLGCMAPLPLILLAFKIYCSKTFADQCKYYTKATLQQPQDIGDAGKKARRHDRVAVKFGHPAIHKPLITPMVHAKAQHVLAEIYRGRLDSDGPATSGFSGIAMDPMSHSQPGKTARFAPPTATREMFEVVPEANLDFAHFKNRAEFADEYGGGGELYGRPADLVSERSHTPASFRTDFSDPRSRSQSPAPSQLGMRRQRTDDLGAGYTAYSDQPGGGGRGLYTMHNDSQRSLLGAAQPIGEVDGRSGEGDVGRERFTLEKWRGGGSGYVGVPGGGDDDDVGGYDAYRGKR